MRKKLSILGIILTNILSFAQIPITAIHTDFNNYWMSTNSSVNAVKPNNSHNLLAFQWNGMTYSTGVNNAKLTANGVSFQSATFKAFPTYYIPDVLSKSTFIGVGSSYGGAGNVSPVPVDNNIVEYLIDGNHGLDLGTGIFNFPVSKNISYDITSIDPSSINDGIPDVVITQIGDISNVVDEFYFIDGAGALVGNKYSIDFGQVPFVGNADWKFYNIADPPTYNAPVSTNPTRKLRLLAFDWSELGLTAANITVVDKLVQSFSGQSDVAFTAFNVTSIVLKVSVSGSVFNDNNAGIPNGNGYANVKLHLKNNIGTTIATTSTNNAGNYVFPNISGGQYIIEMETPTGFYIVGNTDGNTMNTIPITVGSNPVTNKNFGINQPPFANDDHLSGQMNTPTIFNISANDTDPNNGHVVPATINLIPTPGATNIIISGGYTKAFTVPGEGRWVVNASGIITFTPITGFTGDATVIQYTIKDTAHLLSNNASIIIKVEDYCYRTANKTGNPLSTNQGITTLGRAGEADQWPTIRNGGWVALESKTKGFVINRIPTTAEVEAIKTPIEGMMVYDQQANCLKIYTSTDNGVSFSWKCLNKQTCPTN